MKIEAPATAEKSAARYPRRILVVCVLLAAALPAAATYMVTKNYLTPRKRLEWKLGRGHNVMRQDIRLRTALLRVPAVLLGSLRAKEEVPRLVFDINFRNMQKIREKRTQALEKGFIIQGEDDFVPASIRYKDQTFRVKLRLKGDLPDHLLGDKWSFRVHMRGDDHLMGMSRFSIQHPGTRAFQAQPLFFAALREKGILAPRYFFVDVVVNGRGIGLMALEEHFSRELLESQGRRESVIIKFDESLFWEEWAALGNKGPVFNNYQNASIEAFSTNRIAKSPQLGRDYSTAVGLLRGFINGEMRPSEVFDTVIMGRFLAVSELWYATHGFFWNNMRFYFNPVTARLEPVGFDSYRRLLVEAMAGFTRRESRLVRSLLADPGIRLSYERTLGDLSDEIVNGSLIERQKKLDGRYLNILWKEFFLLTGFPFEKLPDRASSLLVEAGGGEEVEMEASAVSSSGMRGYPAVLHAYLYDSDGGPCLEIANAVPETVEVHSAGWRPDDGSVPIPFEPAEAVWFPIRLPPTGSGALPDSRIIHYRPPPPGRGPSTLWLAVEISGDGRTSEVRAVHYHAALKRNPIPEASAEAQTAQHPFLVMDEDPSVLSVKAGRWRVSGSLIVPKGSALVVPAGTTLMFSPGSAIIARGPLYLEGREDGPILLEGVAADGGETGWQGILVLEAGAPSRWSHVTVRGTTGVNRPGWELTGGTTFYKSDIKMNNCAFLDNRAEDTLNIIHSKFDLRETAISRAASDGFDADFADGSLTGGEFRDIGRSGGGDGIDVSGSRVVLEGISFADIGDKALSVGEESNVTAAKIYIESAGAGCVAKDRSRLEISASTIRDARIAGLMAYIKKTEYGPAAIEARGIIFSGNAADVMAQTGSTILVDGAAALEEDIDVDRLYETVMRKGRP